MTEDEYIKLYEKYLAGQCTPEEEKILKDFQDDFTLKDHPWDTDALGDQQEMEQRLLEQLQRRLHPLDGSDEKNNVRRIFWRSAAAALLVGLSSCLYIYYRSIQKPTLAAAEKIQPKPAPDLAPGGDKAILTLSDGAQVVLNDAGKGWVAQQGKTALRKQTDGQLEYIPDASAETNIEEEIGYNTVTTPRGGQYQITLPDGSRVWLNASSSIRFPTRFFGNERRVETTGEVYFEVYKDPSFPFHVSTNGHDIEVLGTTFNLMDNTTTQILIDPNLLRTRASADLATSVDLQELLDERARELSWEGWRRNDLIRFDQFEAEYPLPNDALTMNKDVTRRLYPIPSTELKTNPNLRPNPDY